MFLAWPGSHPYQESPRHKENILNNIRTPYVVDNTSLTGLFQHIIHETNVQEILDILSHNTSGNLYLVGGFVYRSLALRLQGKEFGTLPDLDFVTDKIDFKSIPKEWKVGNNKYGGLKITTARFSIDIDEFRHHVNIKHLSLPHTVNSYLLAVPLNIQSIAYDVRNKNILGDIGIESLNERKICVNNQAIFNLERAKRIEKILDKARDLGYTPVLPADT